MIRADRRRAAVMAVPIVASALMLSACGGNGGQASGNGRCQELKYGILTAFTGELGEFGKTSKNGFDLAISEMKESSHLPEGWTVETVVADEETNIQVGLRAATTMMQSDGVSAILGPSSGPIVAMATLAERNQTPIISQFAGTTNFSKVGGKWLYRTVASDASDGEAVAQWLKEKGLQRVVVVVQNDQSTITAGETVEQRLKETGGSVLNVIKYNPGQPSYQAIVQQAVSANADAIYLAGGQESATTILREMRDRGARSDTIVVSADLVVPDVITAIGADWAEGLAGVTAKADTERREYQRFSEAYHKAYGDEPGIFVENAYDAAVLVGLAAVAANSTCGADLNAKLRAVSSAPGKQVSSFDEGASALAAGEDIDFQGASGPVDFDDTGTVDGSYAVLTVQKGEWVPVKFFPAQTFTK